MKLGDLTLSRFKELLSKCCYIRKCRYCPFQDIECGEGEIDKIELSKLDLEQELDDKLIKDIEEGFYEGR